MFKTRTVPQAAFAALCAAPLIMLASTASARADDGWITNMDDAMKIAAAENKAILMDFTGSDWCGWCIRLKEEVFTHSQFKEYANANFVLVELDFPSNKPMSDEQKQHNEKWRDKVGIEGYPTIVLADAGGEEFARTGYRPGGPDAYNSHLGELITGKTIRDAALAAAEKVDGLARAKMLDWALSLEGVRVPNTESLMREIIDLDNENLLGLKKTYQQKLADIQVDEELMAIQQAMMHSDDFAAMLQRVQELAAKYDVTPEKKAELVSMQVFLLSQTQKFDEAVAMVEAFIADDSMTSEARQQVALSLINIHIEQGNFEKAIQAFENAIAMDPKSELGTMLTGQRGDFMQFIEQMREAGDMIDQ